MKKIAAIGALTATGVAFLINYPTSTNSTMGGGQTGAQTSAGPSAEPNATESGAPASPNAVATPQQQATSTQEVPASQQVVAGSSGVKDGTFDGAVVDVGYGPVQVRIQVAGGKVAAADAIQHPSGDRRSDRINTYAIPVLNQEAVQAQSASINMVSGATYTSQGYLSSLQSALDQAGL